MEAAHDSGSILTKGHNWCNTLKAVENTGESSNSHPSDIDLRGPSQLSNSFHSETPIVDLSHGPPEPVLGIPRLSAVLIGLIKVPTYELEPLEDIGPPEKRSSDWSYV